MFQMIWCTASFWKGHYNLVLEHAEIKALGFRITLFSGDFLVADISFSVTEILEKYVCFLPELKSDLMRGCFSQLRTCTRIRLFRFLYHTYVQWCPPFWNDFYESMQKLFSVIKSFNPRQRLDILR